MIPLQTDARRLHQGTRELFNLDPIFRRPKRKLNVRAICAQQVINPYGNYNMSRFYPITAILAGVKTGLPLQAKRIAEAILPTRGLKIQ